MSKLKTGINVGQNQRAQNQGLLTPEPKCEHIFRKRMHPNPQSDWSCELCGEHLSNDEFTIYRLRKMLAEARCPECDCTKGKGHGCIWCTERDFA